MFHEQIVESNNIAFIVEQTFSSIISLNLNNSFGIGVDFNCFSSFSISITNLELQWGEKAVFTICAAKGDLSLIPQHRTWNIQLRGFHKDASIQVLVDGKIYETSAVYENECNTWAVGVSADVTSTIKVVVCGKELIHDNSDVEKRIFDILMKSQLLLMEKNNCYNIVRMKNITLHHKIWSLGNSSPEQYHLAKAMKELLTLTKEEFE